MPPRRWEHPLSSGCRPRFSSFLSALLLMISLSLANLISQQYLVLVCLSARPLFDYLLTHPSTDFPCADSYWSVNTIVFMSSFLVGKARLVSLLWAQPCAFLTAGTSFPHITVAQRPQSCPSSPQAWYHHHHPQAGLRLQEAGGVLAGSLGLRVCQTWVWVHQFEGLVWREHSGDGKPERSWCCLCYRPEGHGSCRQEQKFPSQTVLGVSQDIHLPTVDKLFSLWMCFLFIKYMTQIGIVVLPQDPRGQEQRGWRRNRANRFGWYQGKWVKVWEPAQEKTGARVGGVWASAALGQSVVSPSLPTETLGDLFIWHSGPCCLALFWEPRLSLGHSQGAGKPGELWQPSLLSL